MCGICGSTSTDASADVRIMNAMQVHRGPDDEGVYDDPHGRISLGARRLSIIDIAAGHQPLSNEDGTVWAILNGEIYNSPLLQQRLRARGHRFRCHADTETLVHLYEDYGDEFVHAIDGMFAFALWDEERGRLVVGRDRFGQKPVFLWCDGRELRFASELFTLLSVLKQKPDVDLDAIDRYMVLGYVPGPQTIVQGIEQLPSASLLTWNSADQAIETRKYWSASRSVRAGREPQNELVAETEHLLERSVEETLLFADVPVGIFLSGGVDSTLVAAIAQARTAEQTKTFTVGYDVGGISEIAQARKAADHLRTEHFELVLTEADVRVRVPRVLGALDQPLADPAVIPLHALSEFARRHVTVAVSGEGADELFGGYPRYRWLVRSTQIKRFLPERYAVVGARALASPLLGSRAARLADVVAPQTTLERHLDWVTAGRRYCRQGLYGPRLHSRGSSDAALSSLAPYVDGFDGDLGADAFMQLDQAHWLPDDVLFKVDRAGMLNSQEIRAPYLARDLAEFANSVRAATHLEGHGKHLLRRALARRLPREVTRRPKTAFRVPGEQWLRGPLTRVLDDQLERGRLIEEGFVNREFLRSKITEHRRGIDHTSILWPVMALGLWLDRYEGRCAE